MRRLAAAACVAMLASAAYADGGRLQVRKQVGPFVVSLFSTPETLAIGDADLSVLVEEQRSGHVLPDAQVSLRMIPVGRPSEPPIRVSLAHRVTGNRLISDAVVRLPHAGLWRADLSVLGDGQVAETTIELTVADHVARRGTIWFFVLAPLCTIAAFLWIEAGKRRARHARLALKT